MLIKVNGVEVEVDDGSTIQEVIDSTNSPYTSGCIVCLTKGQQMLEKDVSKFKIKTTQGSIIIELIESEETRPLIDIWKNQYEELLDLHVRWSTTNEVAIGPIVTDLEPSSDEFQYFEGDVLLSLSGFSNESTHLIFLKENVSNVYAVPPYNKGVFAKIIGGNKTLDKLTETDTITAIEPIVERDTITDRSVVSDLNTVIEEGNELFTYVSLDINDNSPMCVEHLFSIIQQGKIKVDFESNSFLGFYALEGFSKPKEEVLARNKGAVTVRNDGTGVGRLYIYRENRVLAPTHTNVGQINKGMEILDIARKDDYITIKSEQTRIMALNMTQAEASKLLEPLGIEHIRTGIEDDDALIVEQEPLHTMDILKCGKLTTKGIKKENLCAIEFTDSAPRSTWYFKKLTGLLENPIGSLKVHFAFPGMKMVMFEGDKKAAKNIIPENSPEGKVLAGEIGITNMASINVGLIGIRFEDNTEFGPTADAFNATNIIGKTDIDFDILEKLKEGEVLYVTELMYES
ncbi:MAG: methanogenesis marker 3 protein [archaeon]|nr:methanogenesis marker 3 protein [archaeon]